MTKNGVEFQHRFLYIEKRHIYMSLILKQNKGRQK